MILPTKYLPHDRALLTVGGDILTQLDEPRSVSELWDRVRAVRNSGNPSNAISFDWFVLALNLLYAVTTIDYHEGVVAKKAPQ